MNRNIKIGKTNIFQTRVFKIPQRKELRSYDEKYDRWKSAVLKRDNYKCVKCGEVQNLVADHKKSWWTHPTLRYRVSNGRTLCRSCHSKFGVKQLFLMPPVLSEEKETVPTIPLPMPGLGRHEEIVKIRKRRGGFTIPLPSLWIASGYVKTGDLITFVWNEEASQALFAFPQAVFPFELNSEEDLTPEVLTQLEDILNKEKSSFQELSEEEARETVPQPLYLMLPIFGEKNVG